MWPPKEERELWHYAPCPAFKIPLVGSNYLMHIWRNPHHVDRIAYEAWQKRASRFRRVVEWIRRLPTSSHVQPKSVPEGQIGSDSTTGRPRDPACRQTPRSAYIFVKIPKKVGELLEYTYDDNAPEGWGLFFEEGFKPHRLFAILLAYFVLSVGFVAWVLKTYGAIGPTTWSGIFRVIAWIGSFSSLFFATWFKWAESS